jgi:hypothetical protein
MSNLEIQLAILKLLCLLLALPAGYGISAILEDKPWRDD